MTEQTGYYAVERTVVGEDNQHVGLVFATSPADAITKAAKRYRIAAGVLVVYLSIEA